MSKKPSIIGEFYFAATQQCKSVNEPIITIVIGIVAEINLAFGAKDEVRCRFIERRPDSSVWKKFLKAPAADINTISLGSGHKVGKHIPVWIEIIGIEKRDKFTFRRLHSAIARSPLPCILLLHHSDSDVLAA